ncbi:SMI1/KNR4 family protein [Undibacterium sp. JH2W]|uniref:SMI1/KNR4 family protein n=1 Tax=Undibacterium sp. JH2W TaxID=3413037 RepID=UPI003BF27F11
MNNILKEASTLAMAAQIELPALLQALYRDGLSSYGKDRADWQANWEHYMQEAPPALISSYDFEWLDAEAIAQTINGWLKPESQNGRSFFPFAQSGAGDVFCLTAHEGECVVVYIWHDSDRHTIEAFSFADFMYSRLVTAMTDISHLVDDLSGTDKARSCLLADIRRLSTYLPAEDAARLQAYLERPVMETEVSYGRRTERLPCLITDEEYNLLMQGKRASVDWPVHIVARWDV